MAISLTTILTRIRDRLRSYYWTPKIVTVTIGSAGLVSIGQTFQIVLAANIKSASITAGTTSGTTVAAALAANLNLMHGNAAVGDLLVTSSGAVVTITGGIFAFADPTTAGTGTMAVAGTQAASSAVFRDVHVVPMFNRVNPGNVIRNVPGAVVFSGRERPADDSENLSVADISILVLTKNETDQSNETAMLDTHGIVRIREAVKRDFYYRSDVGSASPPDNAIRWNRNEAPELIAQPGSRPGWLAQELVYQCEYVDTVQ